MAAEDFSSTRQEPRWIESELPLAQDPVPPEQTPTEPPAPQPGPRKWVRRLWLLALALLLLCIGLVLMAPWAIGLVLQLRMQEWVASAQTNRSSVRVVAWHNDLQWLRSSGELQVQLVSDCWDASAQSPAQPAWVLRYQVGHIPSQHGWGVVEWSLQPMHGIETGAAWRATGSAQLGYDARVRSQFTISPRQFMWLDAPLHMAPVQGSLLWSESLLSVQLRSEQWRWQPQANAEQGSRMAWLAQGLALQLQARMRDVNGVSRLDAEITPSVDRIQFGRQALQNLRFALGAKDVYWPSVRQFIAAGEGSCGVSLGSKRQLAAVEMLLGAGLQLGIDQLHAQGSGPLQGQVQGNLQLALKPAADGAQDLVNRLQLDAALQLQGAMLSSEQFQSALASGVAVPLGRTPSDGLAFKVHYAQGQLSVADQMVDETLLNVILQQVELQLRALLRGEVAPIEVNPLNDRPPPQPLAEKEPEVIAAH
ncbi:hypothetical protein KIK84_01035 [Curvibacter sp. CHRR-16]|uniref:hypothetical protein n=1 Tax=Curvibacter sp. CHRR-16 TaxID=2835872 RepID=UPI001BDAB9DC|nr:hypothetical protein [Curvibacter sp. CHRR-16]MBT0568897.1 hypothetical protein [Curvibacter sp. CHRR-16]